MTVTARVFTSGAQSHRQLTLVIALVSVRDWMGQYQDTILFLVVSHHNNSISVISWWCYGYEMRWRQPKPTLLLTRGIFNLPHHMGLVWEELAFDNAVSYTQQGNGLQYSYMLWQWSGVVPLSPGSVTPYSNKLSYLPNSSITNTAQQNSVSHKRGFSWLWFIRRVKRVVEGKSLIFVEGLYQSQCKPIDKRNTLFMIFAYI